jgi:predicted nucleic acid-binding Zn ribbon protein
MTGNNSFENYPMMVTHKTEKACTLCGKVLKGRSDKKFCDDYCRSSYNNERKGVVNNYIRNVNNALGKNRRILEGLIREGEQRGGASREKLLQLGFQFSYITHIYTNSKGSVYYYCYDHGYLPLDNNRFLIVRRIER